MLSVDPFLPLRPRGNLSFSALPLVGRDGGKMPFRRLVPTRPTLSPVGLSNCNLILVIFAGWAWQR